MADLRDPKNRMAAAASVSFRTFLRNAAISGALAQGSVGEYLGRAIAARAIPHQRLKRAHLNAGQVAQRAMIRGYTQRRHRRPIPSYRQGDRYSGGALRRALQNQGQVEATEFSLRFINSTILDQEAAHWRRLNFGAGRGSEGGITPPEVFKWEGLVGGSIGLTPDVRPGFTIPMGIFVSPGGGRVRPGADRRGADMFFPKRGARRFPTVGIASSNFLDAGVRTLSRSLPRAYLDMYTSLFNNKARSRFLTMRVGAMPAPAPRLS